MKFYKIIFPVITALMVMSSCANDGSLGYSVTEPDSLAVLDYLKAYQPLKTYVDRTANPNFKLGAGVSVSDFNAMGASYRLSCSNFDEMTAGYEMKEGSVVQSNGRLDTTDVVTFLKNAKKAGMSVYGHNLVWHANQNATYLNSLIAPDTIKSGTHDDEGYAYKIMNPSVADFDYYVQFCYGFSSTLTSGTTYELKFMVKGTVTGSISPCLQSSDYSSDGFSTVSITKDWQSVDITTQVTAATRNKLIISLGKYVGTFYIDNVSLCPLSSGVAGSNLISNGDFETGSTSGWGGWGGATYGVSAYGEGYNPGVTYVVKTSDEKNQILTTEMERYIKGMMTACNPYVYAWDVVNEPMADYPDPSQLKTGVGQTLKSDEFYWQDYLGKDYAVKAFKFARKYGNTNDKLFINEYGLEATGQAKLTGLINYINYIESQGATVDGIGTQMHLTVASADTTAIAEMFKKLAATGKLIKISELDIGIADGVLTSAVTDAQLQAQAKLYNFVARAYFKYVPAAQRYGITIWSPLDSPKTSSWRGGEPIGLWTLQYDRKRAYAGFADGLAGKY